MCLRQSTWEAEFNTPFTALTFPEKPRVPFCCWLPGTWNCWQTVPAVLRSALLLSLVLTMTFVLLALILVSYGWVLSACWWYLLLMSTMIRSMLLPTEMGVGWLWKVSRILFSKITINNRGGREHHWHALLSDSPRWLLMNTFFF